MMDRKRLIAIAHLAAAKLRLDEETRREVQRMVTQVESCRQMDVPALQRLIRHYQRMGADVWLPGPLAPAADERRPQIAKIAALCRDGGYPFPDYPLGIAKRMLGHAVERIEWLPSPVLRAVIAAMSYQRRRKDARGQDRA